MNCVLCGAHLDLKIHFQEAPHSYYMRCRVCDLLQCSTESRLTEAQEKARYQLHENHLFDSGYRQFLKPAMDVILEEFPTTAVGLDYGAGPGPLLQCMFQEQGYKVSLYDPIFHPHKHHLGKVYDFILCTEAAEHFYNPKAEFQRIRAALNKEKARLVIMTELLPEGHFEKWYYLRDPTHVVFYSKQSFLWVAENFNFTSVQFISERLIVLDIETKS